MMTALTAAAILLFPLVSGTAPASALTEVAPELPVSSQSGFGSVTVPEHSPGFSTFNTISGSVIRTPSSTDTVLQSVDIPIHNTHSENTAIQFRALVVRWDAENTHPVGEPLAVSAAAPIPLTTAPKPGMTWVPFALETPLAPDTDYFVAATTLYDVATNPSQSKNHPISLGVSKSGETVVSQLALEPSHRSDPNKWQGMFAGVRPGKLAMRLVFDAPQPAITRSVQVASAAVSYGQPATLSATVDEDGEDGGTVTFSVADSPAGSADVTERTATVRLAASAHPAGEYQVTAHYVDPAGAEAHAENRLVVARADTAITAIVHAEAAPEGLSGTITGVQGTIPSGSVSLIDSTGAASGSATIGADGSFVFPRVDAGTYRVSFAGDVNHLPSEHTVIIPAPSGPNLVDPGTSDPDPKPGPSAPGASGTAPGAGSRDAGTGGSEPLAATGSGAPLHLAAIVGALIGSGVALLLRRGRAEPA